MPLFAYTTNIPDGPNNPSQDQPKMKINTNSIDGILDIDHYSFGEANGGLHRQIQMPNLLAIPAGLSAGTGNLYSKLANSEAALTESNIFFTPSTSTNEYQLTRPITGQYAEFGVSAVDPIVANSFVGWTFLPGGLLFQYGTTRVPSGTQTMIITFPVPFTTGVFSINGTPFVNPSSAGRRVIITAASPTQFAIDTLSTTANCDVYWQAIGK